ncbi:MAG: hypothetical protein COW84_11645 [Gammaproteobacteria bacterium CG22_combo_CG10-13_8_21_14_all_40_8]|nr:MAG: hypothetical protein COW84_11645 [Gammaproteobacteria bacterium CG22_combo_CG10-13_8_21_14_all_40_8]
MSQENRTPLDHYRIRSFSAGSQWIIDGAKLMNGQFVRWLTLMLVFVMIVLLANIIPGAIFVYSLLVPVFWAGIFLAGSASVNHLEWTPGILVEPLKLRRTNLLILGGILMILNLMISLWLLSSLKEIIDFDAFNQAVKELAETENRQPLMDMFADPIVIEKILLQMLSASLFFIPIAMAGWFSPALVFEYNLKPLQALKLSFRACLANFLPFFSYSLVALVLLILSMAFLPLAFFILPLLLATYYSSYRDIWPESELVKKATDEDQISISL